MLMHVKWESSMKNSQNEILLIKVKSPSSVNFFKEHSEIISKYGYVDFAKFGRSTLKLEKISPGDIILIKESISNGGMLFEAVFECIVYNGEYYPAYYEEFTKLEKTWLRLSALKLIDNPSYLDLFETRSGGSVANAIKSISPNFYVIKKSGD